MTAGAAAPPVDLDAQVRAAVDALRDSLGDGGLWALIAALVVGGVAISGVCAAAIARWGLRRRAPVRPPWEVPDAMLVFLALLGLVAGLALTSGRRGAEPASDQGGRLVAILVDTSFQLVFAGGIAGLAALRRGGDPSSELGLRGGLRPREVVALAAIVLTWIPAHLGAYHGWLYALARLGVRIEAQAPVRVLLEGDPLERALVAGFAVLVAPVCEEVVFRGYLYGGLRGPLGRGAALALTAALFALFHQQLPTLLPIFLLGLLLGAVYEWIGTLWAPVLLHVLFNAGNVAVALSSQNLQ